MQNGFKGTLPSSAFSKATSKATLSFSLVALSIVALFFSQVSPAFANISSPQIDSNARAASAEQAEQYQQAESTGQTESSTQPTQIQQIESASSSGLVETNTATQEQIKTTYNDFEVTGDPSSLSYDLDANVLTVSGGEHTISMLSTLYETTECINITGAATITLAGMEINLRNEMMQRPAPITINENTSFDVTILLADDTVNVFRGSRFQGYGTPAIQKHGVSGSGKLTISAPSGRQGTGKLVATGGYGCAGIGGSSGCSGANIAISGGIIEAQGGEGAAGIGGGINGPGKDIAITGGSLEIAGGKGGAGIGGGKDGTGSENSIAGNAVVMAASGLDTKPALEGFQDASGESLLSQGFVFTGLVTNDQTLPYTVAWNEGTVYGDTTLQNDITLPVSLKISAQYSLTIPKDLTLTIPDGMSIQNEGTFSIEGIAQVLGTGNITTATNFYLLD